MQKVVDLTELPFEVANSSDYYHYYTRFFNRDTEDYMHVEDEMYADAYDYINPIGGVSGGDLDESLENSYYDVANFFVFPNQTQYWKLAMFLASSANASIQNAEFLNNNRLTQEDDMMSSLPLRICYDPSYEFEIQNRRSSLIRDDILKKKNNCNQWHIFRWVDKLIKIRRSNMSPLNSIVRSIRKWSFKPPKLIPLKFNRSQTFSMQVCIPRNYFRLVLG